MEGSKNERAAILLTSYLIGFVTAYIAFGVVQLEGDVQFAQTNINNPASVIAATSLKVITHEEIQSGIAQLTDAGLVYINNGEEILLSAKAVPESGYLPEGFHVEISGFTVSPDGEYVYFCERPSYEADSCVPYLYSINNDSIHRLTIDDERVAFEAKNHKISWTENGQIKVE